MATGNILNLTVPAVENPNKEDDLEIIGWNDKADKFLEGFQLIKNYPHEDDEFSLNVWMPIYRNSGVVLVREVVQHRLGDNVFTQLEVFFKQGMRVLKYPWALCEADSSELYDQKLGMINVLSPDFPKIKVVEKQEAPGA